jgi:hypothetical protein
VNRWRHSLRSQTGRQTRGDDFSHVPEHAKARPEEERISFGRVAFT